jgi:hypothetical protein
MEKAESSKIKQYEVLGVEKLTQEEMDRMGEITTKMLFNKDYHKSDGVIDLLKLFEMEDNTQNRRFCLAIMAFGAAAESASCKLIKLVGLMEEMVSTGED